MCGDECQPPKPTHNWLELHFKCNFKEEPPGDENDEVVVILFDPYCCIMFFY